MGGDCGMGQPGFHHDASVACRLRRLEGEFLGPHRVAIALGAAGLLLQSLLLLPVPLLQGWVLDRLVALVARTGQPGPAETAAAARAIALGFLATIACH